MNRTRNIFAPAVCLITLCAQSTAETTVFFDACQVATPINSGVTSDTISSRGYVFTYTRDKLFTGGTGEPIGRMVRVPWPVGVEAQAVTTPPQGVTDYKARVTLSRLDGGVFDLPAFTAKLLANTAGAGGAIEIMPLVNGEDAFNDPLYFDVTGVYGQTFSYDTSPNPWGSTALLTGYDTYKVALYVDFAFVALTLDSATAGDQACCLPDFSCADVATGECVTLGGAPQGVATTCACASCAPLAAIPTISQWGMAVMGLLVLTAGSVLVRIRNSHLFQSDGPARRRDERQTPSRQSFPNAFLKEKHTMQVQPSSPYAAAFVAALATLAMSSSAWADTAYGTLNNFDCVNDTEVETHGFEIELEDIHSTDISYTYDYNHYGVPKITEDNSDPAHPRVTIRYAASKNPDGSWSAFTAIPSSPIAPTDGHQFTNPSVNFGGEHFGVGYLRAPSAVRNFWLIDDGAGNLVHGPPVNVSTPTFSYNFPAGQVQAVIEPPPPPDPPVLQFGDATWVKDIKTTTHNAEKVELRDLVDPDPENPNAQNWTNGEPAEVETEWRILQTEFADPDNPKNELVGAPEDLPDGDEIITRRYEFYKYIGPIDAESGEAMADAVADDGVHGVGSVTYNDHFDPMTGEWVEVTVDLSTIEVVGEFFGAQMSGFDVAPVLGLIDHIPDGEFGVGYPARTVVISGGAAFFATTIGSVPDGMTLDSISGVFSGTPAATGEFTFTVEATDTNHAFVTKSYTVTIPAAEPLSSDIGTIASPADAGSTAGDGLYHDGTPIAVIATHNPGYQFVHWTDGGVQVSTSAVFPFTVNGNRSLTASFAMKPQLLAECIHGPDGGITPVPEVPCENYDKDNDVDVDLADWAVLQNQFVRPMP